MFHTYVMNFKRVVIDLDRATFLMDKKLWFKALATYHERGETDPQWAFSEYCERHWEKYGKPFSVNMMDHPL